MHDGQQYRRWQITALATLAAVLIVVFAATYLYWSSHFPEDPAYVRAHLSSASIVDPPKLREARSVGYSDTEIAEFLAQRNEASLSHRAIILLTTEATILAVAILLVFKTAPRRTLTGKIRRTLRAIRAFVDRRLTTKAVVIVAVLLLAASWIYPPWIVGSGRYVSHGWFFVFDTTRAMVMRVDLGRLLLMDAVIATAGGLLAWTFFQNSTGRRAAVRTVFYTLVSAPIAAVIFLGTVLIQNIRHDVSLRTAQHIKRFDRATTKVLEKRSATAFLDENTHWAPYDALIAYLSKKQPVTVEIPGLGTAEFPSKMSSSEIAAVIKKKFLWADANDYEVVASPDADLGLVPTTSPKDNGLGFVATATAKPTSKPNQFEPDKYLAQYSDELSKVQSNDLKKITLFDVGPNKLPYSDLDGTYTITGFHGRIRSVLPRPIQTIGIKASFYNAMGELIEVRTFTTKAEHILTNTPISFEEYLLLKHLPEGWQYQLEVTEARYAK